MGRDDQLHTAPRDQQLLEQPDPVRRTGRAGDRQDDRGLRIGEARHASHRSTRTDARKAIEITPFIVKKAASSLERSSDETRECS